MREEPSVGNATQVPPPVPSGHLQRKIDQHSFQMAGRQPGIEELDWRDIGVAELPLPMDLSWPRELQLPELQEGPLGLRTVNPKLVTHGLYLVDDVETTRSIVEEIFKVIAGNYVLFADIPTALTCIPHQLPSVAPVRLLRRSLGEASPTTQSATTT